MKESGFTNALRKRVKEAEDTWSYKVLGDPSSASGMADLVFVLQGDVVFAELKTCIAPKLASTPITPRVRLTEIQRYTLNEIDRAGGTAIVLVHVAPGKGKRGGQVLRFDITSFFEAEANGWVLDECSSMEWNIRDPQRWVAFIKGELP